jgi:hypothetical protein
VCLSLLNRSKLVFESNWIILFTKGRIGTAALEGKSDPGGFWKCKDCQE